MNTILVVDDDPQLRQSFKKILTKEGYTVKTASTGELGLEIVRESVPDLVIIDVRLPGMHGLKALRAVHEIESKLPVIVMTAFGTTETAIEATKLGAFDYVLKPFEIPDILALIEQALEAGRFMRSRVEIAARPEKTSTDAIVGQSNPMQEMYKAIGRVAPTNATVLIRGESGTGKELVARAIYQHSLRGDKPFVVINCSAYPSTLLESELFGHEKGAFTGAIREKHGRFEQAHGGTVFLDEIGEISPSAQIKLLRVLQMHKFERLGGEKTLTVDVRVLAATNKDLLQEVKSGNFREDLYYRLNVIPIILPPLRDRRNDIPLLARHFLRRFGGSQDKKIEEFSPEAMRLLLNYSWPGNVRELENSIEHAAVLAKGSKVESSDLPAVLYNGVSAPRRGKKSTLIDNERRLLQEVLEECGWNKKQAAKRLGISRTTLYGKLKKYQIIRATTH